MSNNLPKNCVFLLLAIILYGAHVQGQTYYRISNNPAINSCEGIFLDSGGPNFNYGLNENFTTTICSDGSSGTHIRLTVSELSLGEGDRILFYDGPTATPGTEFDEGYLLTGTPFIIQARPSNVSGCITVTFTSDDAVQGAGWSMAISCVGQCQAILAELAGSTPPVFPQDTGYIDVCPGQLVNFQGRGQYPENGTVYQHSDATSTFEWNFGDGTAVTQGMNVEHAFTNPGGYIVSLTIRDQRGCTNTNFIKQRVRVAPAASFEFTGTPDPTLCSGDTLVITSAADTSLHRNISAYPNTEGFGNSIIVPDTLFLPDGIGLSYEATVNFTQFRPGAILTDASDIQGLTLLLEHSYAGDLDIELICPDGTSASILSTGTLTTTNFGYPWATGPVDGESDDTTPGIPLAYTFTDGAPLNLFQVNSTLPQESYTTVPSLNTGVQHTYEDRIFPAGSYRPLESFNAFLGCPLNGEWTVRITDNLGSDNGWLFSWELAFNPALIPDFEDFTAPLVDYGWDTDPYNVATTRDSLITAPLGAGNAGFTFWVRDAFGCRSDTTLFATVLPPTHPDCYTCADNAPTGIDTLICNGQSVTLDATLPDTEQCVLFESSPRTAISFAQFPPSSPFASSIQVNSIAQTALTNPLEQICSVCISYRTDFPNEVSFTLQAPDGTTLLLTSMLGGNTTGAYENTCFTPTSLEDIITANPPFDGFYQPRADWNMLNGTPINGNWALLVTDNAGQDVGELLYWSITFNSTNEVNYSWMPTAGLSCTNCPNPDATPSTSTVYTLTSTDSYGCMLSTDFTINVAANVAAPNVSCQSIADDVQFNWPVVPDITQYEYNLYINGVPAGWVLASQNSLLVENLNDDDEVTLEVRPFFGPGSQACNLPVGTSTCIADYCGIGLSAATTAPVSCFGVSDGEARLQVSSGQMPYQIALNPGGTVPSTTITGLSAGNYTYTVTDATGCAVTGNFTITGPDSLFVNATQTFQACSGSNQNQALAVGQGGTGNFSYTWNDGSAQQTPTATNLPPGNYRVMVRDANNCTAEDTVNVAELAPITFNFIANPPTCNGYSDGAVGINQVDGGAGTAEGDYTYRWADNATGSVRTGLPGGVAYRVTVSDVQGCEAVQERFLEDAPPIQFLVNIVPPTCFQEQDGSATITNVNGPNPGTYSFQWDNQAGGQTTAEATMLAAGQYTFQIIDMEGCTAVGEAILSQPEPLVATLSIKNNSCFGYADGGIAVNVSGGYPDYSYAWSNGMAGNETSNLVAGDYTVTITDQRGCAITRMANVQQPATVTVTASATHVSCFGQRDGRINVQTEGGTPPFRYSLDNVAFRNTPVFIGQEAGTYTVYVQDANGCQLQRQVTVAQPGEFLLDAGPDLTIIYGDSVQLNALLQNAVGVVDYFWEGGYPGTLSCDDCAMPFASPDFTIDYTVEAVDENGCQAEDIVRVYVEKPKLVVVPTGFTPNGDGLNDLLLVHGRPGTQVLSFRVYDRWGELVFEATDFDINDTGIGWDGLFRGQPMNGGIFLWAVVALHEDGTEGSYRGQTTLLR